MQKYSSDEDDHSSHDSQSKYFNSSLLRNEHEFFKEDENVAHKLINVRRANLRKGEDWEILENNKVVLVLKGIRFTNTEKEFFRTANGMNFIINGYKQGWDSILKFKKELKKVL
jgi:hypothetical protein